MDSRRRILYLSELIGSNSAPVHLDAITKVGLYSLTGRIEHLPQFLYPYVVPVPETPGLYVINGEILMTVTANLAQDFTNTETEEIVPGHIIWQEIDVDTYGKPQLGYDNFVTYKRRGRHVNNALSWGRWRNPVDDAIDKNNLLMFGLPPNIARPMVYDAAEGLLSKNKGFALDIGNGCPSHESVENGVLTMQSKILTLCLFHYDYPGHNEAVEVVIDEANDAYINIVLTNEPDQENAGQGYMRCQFEPTSSTGYSLRGSAMGTPQGEEHNFSGLTYPATFRLERRGEGAKVFMNGTLLADTASAVTTEEPDELFFEGYYYWWQNMITFGEDVVALRRIAYERLGEEG